MNRYRNLLLLLLPLWGGGCALLPQPADPGAGAADGERLRAQARMLRYSGRYAEAVARLDRALTLAPDDRSLREERQQTRLSWQRHERTLSDRLLLLDSRFAQERLPILESRVRAAPDDPVHRAGLDRLRRQLRDYPRALSECGRRQREHQAALARACLRAALALRPDADDERLLASLTGPARGRPRAAPPPTDGATPPEPSADAPATHGPELAKARELIRVGNHFGAVRHLEKLSAKGEGSAESARLLDQARAQLQRNTGTLLAAGDALYQRGDVKAALALWQAALSMDPFNRQARSKSERALKVLANLNDLDEGRHQPGAR